MTPDQWVERYRRAWETADGRGDRSNACAAPQAVTVPLLLYLALGIGLVISNYTCDLWS
jgi:hypothetical protein